MMPKETSNDADFWERYYGLKPEKMADDDPKALEMKHSTEIAEYRKELEKARTELVQELVRSSNLHYNISILIERLKRANRRSFYWLLVGMALGGLIGGMLTRMIMVFP